LKKYRWQILVVVAVLVAVLRLSPIRPVELQSLEDLRLTGDRVEFVFETGGTLTGESASGAILTGMATGEISQISGEKISGAIETGRKIEWTVEETARDCVTPRGEQVADGESVRAYQQRVDQPNLCRVERRLCRDGFLAGSFEQRGCAEVALTENFLVGAPEPKNREAIDPLIQSDLIREENLEVGLEDGRVISVQPETPLLQIPENLIEPRGQNLAENLEKTCQAPRGEQVAGGQFVRAYALDRGFTNFPCQVQLRHCVDGELDGDFVYESCAPLDLPIEDYLDGRADEDQPSPRQLVEILTKMVAEENFVQRNPDVSLGDLVESLRRLGEK